MAIKDRRTRGAAFVLRPAAFAALALLAAKSHGAEIDVGVGAGANMHQISRFENATVPWLGDYLDDGRLRLNRRATGGSPTSYE